MDPFSPMAWSLVRDYLTHPAPGCIRCALELATLLRRRGIAPTKKEREELLRLLAPWPAPPPSETGGAYHYEETARGKRLREEEEREGERFREKAEKKGAVYGGAWTLRFSAEDFKKITPKELRAAARRFRT